MKEDRKNLLIISAVVVVIVLAYILSWLFMKPESKKSDRLRPPVADRPRVMFQRGRKTEDGHLGFRGGTDP